MSEIDGFARVLNLTVSLQTNRPSSTAAVWSSPVQRGKTDFDIGIEKTATPASEGPGPYKRTDSRAAGSVPQ